MKKYFHPEFKFNGQDLYYADLIEVAYSLVKEGEPFEKEVGDFLMDWMDQNSFILQKTSGSTGEPKIIALEKSSMIQSAKTTGKALGLGPGSTALCPLAISTIAGKMMLVRAMVLGWELEVIRPTSDPMGSTLKSYDFTAMVPMQLTKSLKQLHRLRKLIVGGAAIPAQTLSLLPEDGCEIWQTYGMTETSSHIALRKLKAVPEGEDPEKVLPPYKAMEGVELSQDERGCLVVRAPEWLEETLTTNDLVEMESETEFRWLGRMDNVVNSAGVKLFPEVIEARLARLIPNRFFLTGIPDPQFGEKLIMLVEGSMDTEQLKGDLSESGLLEAYEVPKEIHQLTSFKETGSGKVDRMATLSELR